MRTWVLVLVTACGCAGSRDPGPTAPAIGRDAAFSRSGARDLSPRVVRAPSGRSESAREDAIDFGGGWGGGDEGELDAGESDQDPGDGGSASPSGSEGDASGSTGELD